MTAEPLLTRDTRKVLVLLPEDVFKRLGELAAIPLDDPSDTEEVKKLNAKARLCNTDGVARYAEISRVLLASEVLLRTNASRSLRVAMAVLSNSTLILAASLAKLTDDVRTELKQVAALMTSQDARLLPVPRRGSPRTRNLANERVPVLNVTLDNWLHDTIVALANDVTEDQLRTASLRSKVAYTIRDMLSKAIKRPDLEELIFEYAEAVVQIRIVLERAVTAQKDIVRKYLKTVRPPKFD